MRYFILDIETKPDESLEKTFHETRPTKSKNPRKDMSVDPDFCHIVCIGIKEIKKEPIIITDLFQLEDWFNKELDDATSLVTFNGKQFDLPAIIKSGIKHGMKYPYKELMTMTEKYKSKNHFDLMQLLSFGGKYKSAEAYLRVYCNTQKKTLGDDFFANASDQDLIDHCLEDLQFTEDLLKKFRFLL